VPPELLTHYDDDIRAARSYMSSLSPGISSAAAAAGGAINFRSRTTAFNVCCVPLRFVCALMHSRLF